MFFYDTCSLLNSCDKIFKSKERFYISGISLQELENIKTSAHKDAETKYKARHLTRLLAENEDQYRVFPYDINARYSLQLIGLEDNNDSRIIATAYENLKTYPCIFVTEDICCYHLAKYAGVPVQLGVQEPEEDYTGFKVIELDDAALAKFYNNLTDVKKVSKFDLVPNQYLIIKSTSSGGDVVDQYKLDENGELHSVPFLTFDSQMFGTIKPKDVYQRCAMDSIKNNQVTMLGGAAGTGKTMLAFAYLFEQLEKGKIDKIILFCNPVGAKNCAKLGL